MLNKVCGRQHVTTRRGQDANKLSSCCLDTIYYNKNYGYNYYM